MPSGTGGDRGETKGFRNTQYFIFICILVTIIFFEQIMYQGNIFDYLINICI